MSDDDTTPRGERLAPRTSSEIGVSAFRQILVWPLALDLSSIGGDSVETAVETVVAAFRRHPHWEECADLLDHLGPRRAKVRSRDADGRWTPREEQTRLDEERTERGMSYAEFVYFYDFLQRVIFAGGGSKAPAGSCPIRLWRHTFLEEIEFTLALPDGLVIDGRETRKDAAAYRAVVDRFSVYLLDSGAAVVVLEVDFGSGGRLVREAGGERVVPLHLAEVLTVCDHLRRVYTPFFYGLSAAKVPRSFTWRLRSSEPNGKPVDATYVPADLEADYAFVKTTRGPEGLRHAPVAEAWRKILEPLAFSGYAGAGEPTWRHVLDERIPLMSFVSFTDAAHRLGIEPARNKDDREDPVNAVARRNDYALVSRGDWIRLCNADEAGTDPMPYNSTFLEDFEKTAAYDRFSADPETSSASRILFAGYHFVVAGAGTFLDDVVVHHFRRHYFQMMLLANLELASLLVTSSRISEAVSRYRADPGGGRAQSAFMDDLEAITEWFSTFVHRFRFSGVSNQIQPRELYDRMRASMRLDALFVEVKDELDAAVGFNATLEQRRIAESGERLTNVATIGASIGLAFAFLGMNVVIDPIKGLYTPRAVAQATGEAVASPSVPLLRTLVGREIRPELVDVSVTFVTIAVFVGLTFLGVAALARRRGRGRRAGPGSSAAVRWFLGGLVAVSFAAAAGSFILALR